MASLEKIRYTPHRARTSGGAVVWMLVEGREIDGVPQIFWRSGEPWREANMWAIERATSKDVGLKTIECNFVGLHAYAKWLELKKKNWWDLPARKADRCLVQYRGALIDSRESGELAPSTVSQRMRSVIAFYRWVYATRLLSTDWPMWQERIVGIRLENSIGLQRTVAVTTTDISIPNRKARGERLEDGLLPVSSVDRDAILNLAHRVASDELYMMIELAFFTGMRLGTITGLKVQTLLQAVPDPVVPRLFLLSVGPNAIPAVATKFGVNGQIWILKPQLDELIAYSHSVRRLQREAKADEKNRDLVFLTRFGNSYTQRGSEKSVAINVQMHALRKQAVPNGIYALRNFHFHQTRCTFATDLARLAISAMGAINAIHFVKDALLHKDEATSLKYIKFVEKSPGKIAAANSFTREFLGLATARAQGQ